MEELKDAIIDSENRICCPVCGRVHGQLYGGETVRNYIILCRGSRKIKNRHMFVLNVGSEVN